MSEEFALKWQFPHAGEGQFDGKHIKVRAPPNSATEYFNYKKHFSIVLHGIVDANVEFIAFELGSAGSQSDSGIFKDGSLGMFCKSAIFQHLHNQNKESLQSHTICWLMMHFPWMLIL